MTPLTVDDVRAIAVNDLRVAPTRRTDILSVVVEVENGSDRWLTSPQGPHGFNVAHPLGDPRDRAAPTRHPDPGAASARPWLHLPDQAPRAGTTGVREGGAPCHGRW